MDIKISSVFDVTVKKAQSGMPAALPTAHEEGVKKGTCRPFAAHRQSLLQNIFCHIMKKLYFCSRIINLKKQKQMEKYVCNVCGYEYDPAKGDPENGIAPGTKFEDLPADWVCPLCSVDKTHFEKNAWMIDCVIAWVACAIR